MSARKRSLLLSRQTRNDLRDIEAYTLARWDEQQWSVYEEALARALATIEEHPDLGRQRPELGAGLRPYVVREHIVYYRVGDASILVLRIRHGRSDPRRTSRNAP